MSSPVASRAVLTGPPRVALRSASSRPYDSAVAAARTCYAPRVVEADEVTEAQRESIGPLTFDAGHHTVYQHAHFEFGLENVSRQFVGRSCSHPSTIGVQPALRAPRRGARLRHRATWRGRPRPL
jgi:hypothetical protein